MKKLNILGVLIYTLLVVGGNEAFGNCGNYGAGGTTAGSTAFSKFSTNVLAQDSVVRFAFLTDLHISDVSANAEDLEKSVADINGQTDIKFAIFGGDITEFGSDEEIAHAYSIISKLKIPWYIVAGNHDSKWSESGCNTFAKVFGYEHFDFEAGGIRFIGCNSGPNMRMAPALVPRDAVLWLDSLTKVIPPSQPVIFINHYPLDDAMLNYKTVLEYLARINTQVAICGHGHNDRVMKYEQLFSPLRGVMGRSNLRAGKGGAGYNIVTVNMGVGNAATSHTADGTISFQERISGMITKGPWHTIKIVTPEYVTKPGSASSPTLKPRVIFEWQDDSDIGSAAVMDEKGRIYLANTKGVVKAFDSKSNQTSVKPVWQFATDGKIFSTPAISGNCLVVGSSDANIYCINTKNGNLIWKIKAGKSVLASPVIFKGRVYIGASDGIFRALDLKNGKLIWEFKNVKGFVESKPFVDDSGVFFGSWGSMFYALNPINGSLMWSWTNGKGRGLSPAAVWPVKANGKIFIVTPERMTHALDAATGRELWRAKGGRESVGLSPDASAVYVKTMQDTVFAYKTDSYESESKVVATSATSPVKVSPAGRPDRIWTSNTGFGYEIAPSPITSAYGFVFVPTDKGNIFILNEKDGSVYGIIPFSGALINYVQPVNLPVKQPAAHLRILVSSMDGKVALLEL
jgi:outer membrane protein assembly factor BamB/Icc-related predicted phosphoesterase